MGPQPVLANVSWQSWLETQFSILKVFENLVSNFEDWESSFETLKDLEQRFQGNDLILKNKTIAVNKTIDAQLCSGKPAFECMQIFFFVLCIFYKTHAVCLSTLKLITWWQQTNLASIHNFSCQSEWFIFAQLQPGASVLFSYAPLQPAAQN